MRKTALVVLGMHRSGTSSVAGTLALLGAAAPKSLLEARPDNPKGFWESLAVIDLNDRILQAGESWWNDWRKFDLAKLAEVQRAALQAEIPGLLRSEFGDAQTIVLKDPRLCRLWPLWEPMLEGAGYDARYILPVRSPVEVARSLAARNGFSLAEGVALWLTHVLAAEQATRGRPRRITLWADFMRDWRRERQLIEDTLAIDLSSGDASLDAAVDDFLAPDLQRQRGATDLEQETYGHAWAVEGFELFSALALDDSASTYRRIDALSQRFETARDLFGRALGPVLWNAHMAPIYLGERDQARDDAAGLNARLADQVQAVAAMQARVEQGREAIDRLSAETAALEDRHRLTIERLQANLAACTAEQARGTEVVAELSRRLHEAEAALETAGVEHESRRLRMAEERGALEARLARREAELLDLRRSESRNAAMARRATEAQDRLMLDLERRPLRTLWRLRRRKARPEQS